MKTYSLCFLLHLIPCNFFKGLALVVPATTTCILFLPNSFLCIIPIDVQKVVQHNKKQTSLLSHIHLTVANHFSVNHHKLITNLKIVVPILPLLSSSLISFTTSSPSSHTSVPSHPASFSTVPLKLLFSR